MKGKMMSDVEDLFEWMIRTDRDFTWTGTRRELDVLKTEHEAQGLDFVVVSYKNLSEEDEEEYPSLFLRYGYKNRRR